MLGSVIAATVLYILPEALRDFSTYRMLIYAIVLILVMLLTNNPKAVALREKLFENIKAAFKKKPAKAKGGSKQ